MVPLEAKAARKACRVMKATTLLMMMMAMKSNSRLQQVMAMPGVPGPAYRRICLVEP